MHFVKRNLVACLIFILAILCTLVLFTNSKSNRSNFWNSLGIEHTDQISTIKFYQSPVAGDMNLIPSSKAMEFSNNSSDIHLLFDYLSHTTTKPGKAYKIDGFQLQNPMFEVDTVSGDTIHIHWIFNKGEIQVGDDLYYISKKYAEKLYELFLTYHNYRGELVQ